MTASPSKFSIVFDKVEITSAGLFVFVRGVNIAANASSVMFLGKLIWREIGRWREKNEEAEISVDIRFADQVENATNLRLGGICCVLGTLGRFHATSSFAFRLLVLDDFFSLSGLVCRGSAGTSCP